MGKRKAFTTEVFVSVSERPTNLTFSARIYFLRWNKRTAHTWQEECWHIRLLDALHPAWQGYFHALQYLWNIKWECIHSENECPYRAPQAWCIYNGHRDAVFISDRVWIKTEVRRGYALSEWHLDRGRMPASSSHWRHCSRVAPMVAGKTKQSSQDTGN